MSSLLKPQIPQVAHQVSTSILKPYQKNRSLTLDRVFEITRWAPAVLSCNWDRMNLWRDFGTTKRYFTSFPSQFIHLLYNTPSRTNRSSHICQKYFASKPWSAISHHSGFLPLSSHWRTIFRTVSSNWNALIFSRSNSSLSISNSTWVILSCTIATRTTA